jgi:translation initiation factor eIF-2B subunit gamma
VLAPADLTQTTGTGELLRLPEVQKAITTDFVILPCDLISEVEGSKIVQQWLTLNPLSVSVKTGHYKSGMGVFYPTQGLEGISHKKDETDFIATVALPQPPVPAPSGSLRPDVEELVTSMPTDTLRDLIEEDSGKSLKIRQSLIAKHGRVKMKTKHRDAHVYIFPRWVKELAVKNEKFDSISEDVLGWWAKAAWQDGLGSKLGLDEILGGNAAESMHEDDEETGEEIDISKISSTSSSQQFGSLNNNVPAFASRVKTAAQPSSHINPPPFLAYVQPSLPPTVTAPNAAHPLIRRIDTAAALLSTSLYIAKQSQPAHPLAHEHKVHPSANIGMQARVSTEDSLVAENVKIGMRCNVKESIIGPNCEIGANARLTRCLLMDGVSIGDGVQLTGCIVGRRARIEGMKPVEPVASAEGSVDGEKAAKPRKKKGGDAEGEDDRTKLTECEVAPGYVVEAGTVSKGDKLMAFDTEGDFDEDDDEDDEDDEDDGDEEEEEDDDDEDDEEEI